MTSGRDALTTFAVGIDPGTSTGLAIVRGDGFRLHVEQGPPQLLDDFPVRFPFLYYPGTDVLVGCERFVVTRDTARHSAQPAALGVIGVVERICRLADWPLYLQTPYQVKRLVSQATLRDVGLYVRGRDVERADANDANDALRHALAVLAFHRATLFDEILSNTTM
jgi:hypothetical protein